MTSHDPNFTPETQVALGSDPDKKVWDNEDWNCARVIRMLLRALNDTRLDIAFAASQVAQFSANLKVLHARAVKLITNHPAGTADKKCVVEIDDSCNPTCWVDADFAGLFGQ